MSFDYFNVPDNSINNQVFYTKGSGTDFQIWTKPKNVRLVHILCIGSGGGGGGGQPSTSGTARRGGGGGGSAGYSFGVFQASLIPNNLFLLVPTGGAGGIGGSSSTNGGGGTLSYVSIESNITAINILIQSGAVAPTGGTSGLNGGNAGTGGTVYAGGILDLSGITRYIAGQNGTAGQTTAVPTDLTLNRILSGGSAGAGTNGATPQAGANIIGGGYINNINGGAGSSSGIAGNGSDGYISQLPMVNGLQRQPLLFTGGAGGGSSNTGTGGTGGSGAFGSGGGGGGAGFTALAGNGGRGGDGLIIINCY
jgi:hypothetical protein